MKGVPLETALRVETPNYDYNYLCAKLWRKRMIPLFTRLRASSVKQFGSLVRHSGEEFTYVLKGTMVLHTEFYAPVTLSAGQSIYFDSSMGARLPDGRRMRRGGDAYRDVERRRRPARADGVAFARAGAGRRKAEAGARTQARRFVTLKVPCR